MLIETKPNQKQAILGAMSQVATGKETLPLSTSDRLSLEAANRYVFRAKESLKVENLPKISAQELKTVLVNSDLAEYAVRFLTVMAFVDGVLDENKIATVLEYAAALDVHEDYLQELTAIVQHHLAWALADMSRRNLESIREQPWTSGDTINWFLPYKGKSIDPALVNRYRSLNLLPKETLGRAFWEFYQKNGYDFPGEEKGLNERFATPHDSTHILSGYNTASPRHEILVSTFTAGMHRQESMAGHILPIILSWHLGIKLNDVAGSAIGALDPEEFWHAWVRGSEINVDLFDGSWDFWAVTAEKVDDLRDRYNISPPGSAIV